MDSRLQFEWYDIESDPGGWDANVARLGQNLFHRSAMLAAQQFGHAFRRGVVVKRFGSTACLVGGLIGPSGNGGSFHAFSFPRQARGLARELPRALSDWLLAQGVTRIDLGSFDGGVEGYAIPAEMSHVTDRYEFVYDLTLSEEQRLQLANTHHRRKLRKAQQESMTLRRISRRAAWIMAWLNRAWARRRGERHGMRRFLANYGYYRQLTSALSQDHSANLYGLYSAEGRILSMAYMLERGESSFYMIGASSDEGYRRGASVRLFWELARHYPGVGINTLNLGGVPAAARREDHEEFGVYRFKTGFGIEPVLRQSLTIEA